MYIILSIDGGGMKGIVPLQILQNILSKLGGGPIPIDYMAGTSTGALIAMMLGLKHTVKDTLDWYLKHGPDIFYVPWYNQIRILRNLWNAKYDATIIESLAKQFTQGKRIHDLAFDFIIPTANISTAQPCFWTKQSDNIELWKLARMATAAPTYFDPFVYRDESHVDGGLFCNNPAELALVNAFKLGHTKDDILLISIGTGKFPFTVPANDTSDDGLLEWAAPVSSTMMHLTSEYVDYQVSNILTPGLNYFRLDPILPSDIPMDTTNQEDYQALIKAADEFCKRNKKLINTIVDMIKGSCNVQKSSFR